MHEMCWRYNISNLCENVYKNLRINFRKNFRKFLLKKNLRIHHGIFYYINMKINYAKVEKMI